MNCSRPPPAPTGSYAIVTSGLELWNPAIQACWAATWALEPAPARLPDSDALSAAAPPPPLAAGVEVASSLSPQAAAPSASAAAIATGANRLIFIVSFLLCSLTCGDTRRPLVGPCYRVVLGL